MIFTQILLIIIIIFLIIQIIKYIQFQVKSKDYVTRVTSWIPFFGNIVDFAKGPLTMVKNYSKDKDIFSTHILGKEITFLTHPRHYHLFFKPRSEELGTQEVYKLMTPIFGKGLVYDAPSPSVMSEQLHYVVSGIKTTNFRFYSKIFHSEVMQLLEKLPESGKFNAFEIFAELIIGTASRCLLGDEIRNFIDPKELAKLYHDLDVGINPLTFFFPSLTFLPGSKGRDLAREKIFSKFKELIKLRREKGNETEYGDTLGELMNGYYKSGEKLPDDHICGILLGGLFAGQHTR
jgi:sterol 14alpha-demethylase